MDFEHSTEFFWDVFLCHSKANGDVVRDIASRLKSDGVKVWFDEWEIGPGDSIPAKIEDGLEHSRGLVLCMSAEASGSDWAQLESHTFRFKDPLNHNRRFIPLRLDNEPVKGSLAQFRCIDWGCDQTESQYVKLLEVCRRGRPENSEKSPNYVAGDNHFAQDQNPAVVSAVSDEGIQINAQSHRDLTDSPMNWIWCPNGTFIMGDPRSDENQFQATLSSGFWISKYPVTMSQWIGVMSHLPRGCKRYVESHPVTSVTWDQALDFCNQCMTSDALTFTLPTEAQWEYACRLQAGASDRSLDSIAWYSSNSDKHPQAVGQKEPNSIGIYDMLGNVSEWCLDARWTYGKQPIVDPQGPERGMLRACRGGNYTTHGDNCTPFRRNFERRDRAADHLGFRIVARVKES